MCRLMLVGKMISVVINNYNYAQFVALAMGSALFQRHCGEVEVIVVDDGSVDDSWKVISAFSDRVKCIRKPNGGQGSAYNSGFAASSGDVIVFLDADDLLDPDLAQTLLGIQAADVSLFQWQLRSINEQGEPIPGSVEPELFDRDSPDVCLIRDGWYRHPPASGNAYSRAFLERVLPMPEKEFRYWADLYLLYSAPFYGRREVLSGIHGSYRRHGSNHSVKQGRLSLKRLTHRVETHRRRLWVVSQTLQRLGRPLPENFEFRPPFAVLDRLLLGLTSTSPAHRIARPFELLRGGCLSLWHGRKRGPWWKMLAQALLLLVCSCALVVKNRLSHVSSE